MKILSLVLPVLLLLTTPAIAVEYQGKNIDGRKIPAKVYNYATGGVYNVQVSFQDSRATIYFNDDSETSIRLNRRVISDLNNIEGFGKLGQIALNEVFSIGLDSNNLLSNGQIPPGSRSLEGLWRISVDSASLNK
jgi:hypothetical protein